MKKLLTALFLFCLCYFIQAPLQAQQKGEVRVQTLALYDHFWKDFGVNAGVELFFADKFSFAPSFSHTFPSTGRRSHLNADLRYYLSEDNVQVYLLAGVNNRWRFLDPVRESRAGANLGAGSIFKLGEHVGIHNEVKFHGQQNGILLFHLGLSYFL